MKRFIAKGITVILLAAALAFPLASRALRIKLQSQDNLAHQPTPVDRIIP